MMKKVGIYAELIQRLGTGLMVWKWQILVQNPLSISSYQILKFVILVIKFVLILSKFAIALL